jgi:two-component system sensor histidine kinase KdpD
MVCLGSKSPNPAALLRKGARLAARLNAPWYAVYIQTPGEEPERVEASVQRQVANNLALAHQLGGVPMTFKGPDVVSTIATFVKEYAITLVLLGRTQRRWYARWFGQSVLDRLLRAVRGVDVLVAENA